MPGKVATSVQFGAVMAAIVAPWAATPMLVLAGVTGAVAGISYWKRELERGA